MDDEASKQDHILVVDDDETMRLLAESALESAGFSVQTLSSGDAASKAIDVVRPDLVLLDVDMPGMDGFECCETIRATPFGRDLPIIMITGLDDVDSIHRAYEVGATDFAPKPVQWIILGQRIRYILRASQSFRELSESRERLAQSQRVARLGTWRLSSDGLGPPEMEASEELLAIFAIDPDDKRPMYESILERVHPEDRAAARAAGAAAVRTAEAYDRQYRIVRPDGSTAVIRCQAKPEPHPSGEGVVVHGVSQDITDRLRAESQIRHLETHDQLTGLGNRRMLLEQLQRALARCPSGVHVALSILELSDLRRLDDLLGAGRADGALRRVATRLEEELPRWGGAPGGRIVARTGDTQLALLLVGIDSARTAGVATARALEVLCAEREPGCEEFELTARAGIAIGPDDGNDAESLLRCAQAAVRQASEGRATEPVYYDRELHERSIARVALEARLREAIDGGRIQPFFQPKFRSHDRGLCGAEALARWLEPEGSPATPDVFIPLAEEAGMIGALGESVLRQACAQWRAWAPRVGDARVSVNLSPLQLAEPGLTRWIGRILEGTGLAPRFLEIEVTESALLQSETAAITTLEDLRRHGIEVALDDFGTGYSSLSQLRKLPLDTVKIDRSFILELEEDEDSAAVVSGIVSLCHALRLRVVAEGVETEGQLRALAAMGCDEIQGYLLGRPAAAEDFEADQLERGRS
jgi:diguanylate cyclase (GGDEF)-like protein